MSAPIWYPHGEKAPHAAYAGFEWQRLGGHIGTFASLEEAEACFARANAERQHGPEVTIEEVDNVSYVMDLAALRPEMEARRENPAIAAILKDAEETWRGHLGSAWDEALDGNLGPDAYEFANRVDGQLRKAVRGQPTWNVRQSPYYLHAPKSKETGGIEFGWEGLHGDTN